MQLEVRTSSRIGPFVNEWSHCGVDRGAVQIVFCTTWPGAISKASHRAAIPGTPHIGVQTPHTAEAWQLRPTLPLVYRWAYDYSVPGADQDFIRKTSRRERPPDWQQDVGGEESNDVSRFHELMVSLGCPPRVRRNLGDRDTSSRAARKLALRVFLRWSVLFTLLVIAYAGAWRMRLASCAQLKRYGRIRCADIEQCRLAMGAVFSASRADGRQQVRLQSVIR